MKPALNQTLNLTACSRLSMARQRPSSKDRALKNECPTSVYGLAPPRLDLSTLTISPPCVVCNVRLSRARLHTRCPGLPRLHSRMRRVKSGSSVTRRAAGLILAHVRATPTRGGGRVCVLAAVRSRSAYSAAGSPRPIQRPKALLSAAQPRRTATRGAWPLSILSH